MQQRLVCPHCGKVFFAWRPDTAPGAKIKCYFCKREVEDEASMRRVEPAPAGVAPSPESKPESPEPSPSS